MIPAKNIRFTYLYRDAGNWKNHAEVIFANGDAIPIEIARNALVHAFMTDGLFIAHHVRVPDAFLFQRGNPTSDDHCFHEFDRLEETAEHPTDQHSRSIAEFVGEVQTQSGRGWIAFDPSEPAGQTSNEKMF